MIAALKTDFELLYSIELDGKLFLRAQKKFKKVNNIRLIFGDSGGKSKEVMALIDRPTLFYLDGHYSGGITAKGEKGHSYNGRTVYYFRCPRYWTCHNH